MDRFSYYKSLLSSSSFFKLVCGAGNEDCFEVERLAFIYTLAGCKGFDISANVDVVSACKEGIVKAYNYSEPFYRDDSNLPIITVSVGMPGDHHVRKAYIEPNKCVSCNLCIPVCPTDAIPNSLEVVPTLCIGCGNCEAVCPPAASAIAYTHSTKQLASLLPECISAGAESVELHAGVPDDDTTMAEWNTVSSSVPDGMISMCLDRHHLSNQHLIERIRSAHNIAGDRLIIQADGIPMSGGKDDFNTTLQAISIADIIQKDLIKRDPKFRRLPLLISGGTNSHTGYLATQCDVSFSGITIGTHARGNVKPQLSSSELFSDSTLISNLVSRAYSLIQLNLNGLHPDHC